MYQESLGVFMYQESLGAGNESQHKQFLLPRFLLKFSHSINRHLAEVWEARFPLLLHYLEQQGEGGRPDLGQWQSWLLDLVTDSARKVIM